uniref:non-hydrolyzing UDP-N-acetylglucosamine 2-epimerase n=1 Tax=Streptomyces polyasparticus TaxID=2767826 RepID=UPI003F685C9E
MIRGLSATERLVVDTGQHFDQELSAVFWKGLQLPLPDKVLSAVGGRSRSDQFSRIVSRTAQILDKAGCGAVLVQGDTNSACAGALAANFIGIPVVHVEAGLRSHDRAMPEEINRKLIGVVADLHCAPTEGSAANLRAEGVPASRIAVTGNTVVEVTLASLPDREERQNHLDRQGLIADQYILATVHRPENTDTAETLAGVLTALSTLPLPVLMPLHPRTRKRIAQFGLSGLLADIQVTAPLDHRAYLAFARHAALVISDSGGMQEEVTVLKRPLLVVRRSTERPEAFASGFAQLVRPGTELSRAAHEVLQDRGRLVALQNTPSPFGDGMASARILELVRSLKRVADPVVPAATESAEGERGLFRQPLRSTILTLPPEHARSTSDTHPSAANAP